MIAVDTNLLVYSHRKDMPFHDKALSVIEGLIYESNSWAIPWPCIHEFIAIVTNPRIFKTPTPLSLAFDAIHSLHQGNNLHFLGEGPEYLVTLASLAKSAATVGAKIHDARIAAICIHHGINELYSCDRDFSFFPKLKVKNPLL
jgi:hypothetical protein